MLDGQSKPVPTFMATSERPVIADDPNLIDRHGTLKKPFLRLKRVGIDRTKGFYGSAAEDDSITISRQVSGKTNNVQNLHEARWGHTAPGNVIYEIITMPFPDYFVATYELEINTVTINNTNEIMETIFQSLDHINQFKMPDHGSSGNPKDTKDGGFFYVGFLDTDVRDESNLDDYSDQEREIRHVLSFRVGGIILGSTDNMPNAVGEEEGVLRMRKYYTSYKITFNKDEETFVADTAEEIERWFG